MQRRIPLQNNKSLRPSQKPRKRLKLDQKSARQLQKEADKWFSQYVRLRDSERVGTEWYGKCITCSYHKGVAYIDETGKLRFVAGWDNGHFIGRGNKYLRYDEENCNLQCKFHCNNMLSGNIEKYKPALDAKYGAGTWQKLSKLAQDNRVYSLNKPELLQIIHDAKSQIEYYKNHGDDY